MRFWYVIKKEFKEFIRDRGFILTLVIEPFILMLVFGYTFQADIKNIHTIVYDEDQSQYSAEVVGAIQASDYFAPISFNGTLEEAKEKVRRSEARAILYIPQGFEEKLNNATRGTVHLI
ncbi:ABC transporter permease, partial [Patescibacteria group bacterium]